MRACSALVAIVLLGTLIGCNRFNSGSPGNGSQNGTDSSAPSAKDESPDVGEALYTLGGPPVPPPARRVGGEPIVIPNCYVQYEDRQQVSAEVEGKIEIIGSPLSKRADGRFEWKQPGAEPIIYDPAKPHPSIVFHPRDPQKTVPYWKLAESDFVAADQVLCLLDDQMIAIKKKMAVESSKASVEVQDHAAKGAAYVREKIELYRQNKEVIPRSQQLDDLITLSRFLENLAQANLAIAKANQEVEEADQLIAKHQVRSRVDGIIRSVAKRPGEYVRPGEKIFEIQSTEKVRLEGMLDRENAARVSRNMIVTVEPALPSAPVVSLWGHRQGVGGVAVTGHADRPLIVSAGLDGFVKIRDPNLGRVKDRGEILHNLPHPVPARVVACTPPSSKAILAITGANDGKVRIWDLTDPLKLPSEPKHVPADYHTSPVTAIALNPDGRYAATAAGREVFVWDLAAGERLYALPPEHRDAVTAVSFTPQGTLITAAKDRTLKVWKLGLKRGAVDRTVDHRQGVVDTLGVSPDGARMLFDQDKSRIDLVNVVDGQTTGQLGNVGPGAAFATLAVFGPDHGTPDKPMPYTIVTAGGDGELKGALQVWQAPKAGGRAAEIARLVTPDRVPVTCAAFSPHKDVPFLVVGTAEGTVHVWTPPTGPARKLEGRITFMDPTDPRYYTVRVEMSNKEFPLDDHSTATVIVPAGER
jgi:WD40 repeat protein